MLASCYFTTVPDPQRKILTPNNNVTYIRRWYESGGNLIFHDNLSEEFTEWFPKATFIKVPSPDMDLYKYRWIVYYNYLKEHKEIEDIFFTDISDCFMVRKPEIEPGILYCGDEERSLASWIRQATVPALNRLPLFDELLIDIPLLNAGIVGGTRDIMMCFLRLMNNIIDRLNYSDKQILGDMAIFNYVVITYFSFIHGFPVNSRYLKNEVRNDVWFIHK